MVVCALVSGKRFVGENFDEIELQSRWISAT